MKVAISLTVHENYDVVIDQIKNIRHFVKSPIIVVHVNKDSEELFNNIKQNIGYIRNHICADFFLTEKRVVTSKDSYCLDIAHVNNYELLDNIGIDYDYFLLEASNSLFVRHDVEIFLEKYDAGNSLRLIDSDDKGFWTDRVRNHELYTMFSKKLLSSENGLIYKSIHEGSFYKKNIAKEVMHIVKLMRELCVLFHDFPSYPTEEFWFSLALKYLKDKNPELKISQTLNFMPWQRNLSWSVKEVEEFLAQQTHHVSIKRINRNYDDEVRTFIRNKFRY